MQAGCHTCRCVGGTFAKNQLWFFIGFGAMRNRKYQELSISKNLPSGTDRYHKLFRKEMDANVMFIKM
jgi:hypothetical protein